MGTPRFDHHGRLRLCRTEPLQARRSLSAVDAEKRRLGRDSCVGISTTASSRRHHNLPKFKRISMVATFAVKNMFGCVSGKHKALWHFRQGDTPGEFCKLLLGVYQYLHPALTIIDGVVAMEGQGPIRGPSKPLGWLICTTPSPVKRPAVA
jgi:hypothetical protein